MYFRRIATLLFSMVLLASVGFAQDEPRSLPPIVVEPDEVFDEGAGDVERNSGFPDLRNLDFGQRDGFGENTGAFRGAANLFDVPNAASITTRQAIVERQAADMLHALQNEVGVLMQSTAAGQASPFVRGVTGQQVLILIDGVRLNNSTFRFGPNQYFNTIDPGMVDHIEVIRGGGSVLWGSDAIGGVINVVTRSPSTHFGGCCGYTGAEFNQFYSTSNGSSYSRLNVEGWVGGMGAIGGGSFLNVRDLDTGFDAFPRQPGTNYQQYSGDIKFNYLLNDFEMLTVALQHHEIDGLPRSDRFPGYPGDLNLSNTPANARFFDPQQRDLAYIRYQSLGLFEWSDALTFTASYHRQREIQTRGAPTTRHQETDVESVGLNLVSSRELAGYGKVTAGADWYHDDVDSSFGGSASGPIIPDDATYERIGAFVNWDTSITECLSGVVGVRYEHIDVAATPTVMGAPVHIEPSFGDWVAHGGLVYELTCDVNLVASISEGYRAPNLDELTANNPNVLQQGQDLPSLGLIPERSVNYEVGVKTNFENLRTQTFVFWTDLDNNIVPVSAGANQFRRANQDSYIQGVEFDGEWLFADDWSLYGNFWYTYGRNDVTGGALSRIPPTQGIVGVRWRASDQPSYCSLYTWIVRRQDRLDPVRDVGDERIPIGGTPGYATLNLRAGRAYGCDNQHRVSLSLENITDKNYLVHGSGVYGAGFTARLGYAWEY